MGLSDSGRCPICERGVPDGVIAERETTWVTTAERVVLAGYVCVVSKRHVVEPYELEREEGYAFWDDVLDVAESVARLLKPAKVNYEIDPVENVPLDELRAALA